MVTDNIDYCCSASGGYAPITIEELVSSPRILPHQHHNKLPPQASYPLKITNTLSSSSANNNDMKVTAVHCCSSINECQISTFGHS